MPSFRNVKFDREISWGAEFTPEFQTNIAVTGSGDEYRDIKWANGKLSFQVAHLIKEQYQADWIIAFFRLCRGKGHTFRFQDRSDHRVEASQFGVGDDSTTVFGLYKAYNDGLETLYRRIVLPDPDEPLTIFNDGSPVDSMDYSIDYVGGVVTFNTAPAMDEVLTWTGRFDIPCRFGLDKITGELVDYDVYNFSDIPIQEVRPEEIIKEFGLTV